MTPGLSDRAERPDAEPAARPPMTVAPRIWGRPVAWAPVASPAAVASPAVAAYPARGVPQQRGAIVREVAVPAGAERARAAPAPPVAAAQEAWEPAGAPPAARRPVARVPEARAPPVRAR
ncbi:MAG: hypothetical protein ABIS92_14690 [Polyangia bacterium]